MKAFSLLYQRSHFIQQAVSNVILNKKWLKPLYTVLSLLHTEIALYLIKSMHGHNFGHILFFYLFFTML